MTEITIPPSALARLRTAYSQFEQLAVVISEAMNLPPDASRRLDLERGVFVTEPPVNGQVHAETAVTSAV